MAGCVYRVGELARRTGLTVRTLHYYHEIGLLVPARRTGSGHRLYEAGDIERLQRIQSLRQMGLSLEELRELLDRPGMRLEHVLELQIARLRERIEAEQRLCRRLEALSDRLQREHEVPIDEVLETLEVMSMFEKYYTAEQLEQLRKRGEELGQEHIKQVELEWPQLIAGVRAAIQSGMDPASAESQAMAKRWMELIHEFTGGDPGIERSLRTMYQQEPGASARFLGAEGPPMQDLMGFVRQALEAAKSGS